MIVAGKTGGHIFPGIALAREIRARRPEAPVLFVGTADGLETRLVPEAGFPLETVTASGFASRASGKILSLGRLRRVPRSAGTARAARRRRPEWANASACRSRRAFVGTDARPRLNALPGIATKLLNRFATRTAVGLAGPPVSGAAGDRDGTQ